MSEPTLLSMARWAHALRAEDAPAAVRERLRLQAASILGGAAAAVDHPDLASPLSVARRMGDGPLQVAPGVDGLTVEGALFAGSCLSMAREGDDWMLCAHPTASVWASWLGAAFLGLPWDDALRAQLAANEIAGRLGGLVVGGRSHGQALGFVSAVTGALVAGLLRNHTPEQLAASMGLALTQAHHVDTAQLRGAGRVLTVARPLLDGWRLAELVEGGLTGPIDVLDSESDFVRAFSGGRPAWGFITGLPVDEPAETTWLTTSLALSVSPLHEYVTTALDALDAALAEAEERLGEPVDLSRILRLDVDCCAPSMALERQSTSASLAPNAVARSIRKAIAIRLVRGAGGDLPDPAWIAAHTDAIGTALGTIRLHHDWRLTLGTWAGLAPIQPALAEIGPGALLAALGPGASLDAGLSLAELPLSLAGDKVQDPEDLPALVGRGLSKLGSLAARSVERFLPAALALKAPAVDLASASLDDLVLAVPCRVRLLLHGGHVVKAEASVPAGAPGSDAEATAKAVRAKLLAGLLHAAPGARAAHEGMADSLLGPGNGAAVTLPGAGPAVLLTRP